MFAAMNARSALSKVSSNRAGRIGALILSLLFVAPILFGVFYNVVNFIIGILGIGTPVPFYAAGIVLVASIFFAVWGSFEIVDRFVY
jgi:uncharacterized membrane protein